MMGMAPDHDHLTVIQKVEVFEHALDSTSGEDLHKVRIARVQPRMFWTMSAFALFSMQSSRCSACTSDRTYGIWCIGALAEEP